MKQIKHLLLLIPVLSQVCSCTTNYTPPKYEPTWESLAAHNEEPEWLKDAKFGLYFTWGPYTVPAYGSEWYARTMFIEGANYGYHKKTYGENFYYHDFVPMFTAEHFDPAEWAELFKKAGVKFAGPIAEHHDGFSMWDSDITPWNAKDMGPKRDVLGELFVNIRKQGLKTISTFHHARNLQRYKETWKEEIANDKENFHKFWQSHYPYTPEFQEVFDNPKNALLYGSVPKEEWEENIWLGKLKEVVDKYQPDIIWFDSWLDFISEERRQRFSAYYLNAAEKWDKEVAIVRKQNDLPLTMSINDHEKSREPKVQEHLWMTDDTFSTGSWSYTSNLVIKPTSQVLHSLIDAVSKNGIFLLNISPTSDGIIPDNQRKGLLELGAWLGKYGEAIYATRPWFTAAEGPTVEPDGGFADEHKFLKLEYSSKDIRYTRSKDNKTIYATTLGIPVDGETITMEAFTQQKDIKIAKVEAMSGDKVKWDLNDNGLQVTVSNPTGEFAYPIRITLE